MGRTGVALGAALLLIFDLGPRRHGMDWDANQETLRGLRTERGLGLRSSDGKKGISLIEWLGFLRFVFCEAG